MAALISSVNSGWQINTDLEPLDVDEVRNIVENVGQKKMSNALWEAHQIAAESHDLQYFKDMLRDHEQRRVEDAQIAADLAAAKEAAKEAKQESKKTKSKKVVADDDVEMADASEEPASKTKSTKKRKKDTDEATPKVFPSTLNLLDNHTNDPIAKAQDETHH